MQEDRQRRFAVFDIDGTLIRWQLFHAIVHSLGKCGYLPPDAHDRIGKARMEWKTRRTDDGFGRYEAVLVKEYLAALKQISPQEYEKIVSDVFDEYKDQIFTYTRELIKRLKRERYFLLAISGSHHEIIQKLAKHYGFDVAIGASIEQIDGRFSGRIDTPVFDKAKALQQVMDAHNLQTAGSIAVGDSASDIPMLAFAETPIVFNPDKKMFKIAREKQWKIVVERKNMIYELKPVAGSYQLDI